MNATRLLGIAGLSMAVAIVIGALASHALRGVLEPRQLESLHTAVNYQIFNSLGLMIVGLLWLHGALAPSLLRLVGALLIAGIVCFSGGIYVMLAGAPRVLGLVTPVGGLALIAGWLILGIALLRR